MTQIGQILAQALAQPTYVNVNNGVDMWSLDDDIPYSAKAKHAESVYTVKTDVLAHIIAALEADVSPWEIGTGWKQCLTADPDMTKHAVTPLLDHHISRAAMIRRYYRNKLTLLSLKQHSMSQFRQDLYDFLTMPETQIKLSFLPMMIRLPAFYQEDVTVDELIKTHKSPSEMEPYSTDSQVRTLQFVNKTHRKSKQQDTKHYWFVDDRDMLHRLSIDQNNKLRHVFERFLDQPVVIKANYPVTVLKGRHVNFYSIDGDWRML